jgi:hypothetical protein
MRKIIAILRQTTQDHACLKARLESRTNHVLGAQDKRTQGARTGKWKAPHGFCIIVRQFAPTTGRGAQKPDGSNADSERKPPICDTADRGEGRLPKRVPEGTERFSTRIPELRRLGSTGFERGQRRLSSDVCTSIPAPQALQCTAGRMPTPPVGWMRALPPSRFRPRLRRIPESLRMNSGDLESSDELDSPRETRASRCDAWAPARDAPPGALMARRASRGKSYQT